MLEVVCDTSFLINLATRRIKNISNIEHEIGMVQFVVPDAVVEELKRLQRNNESKSVAAMHTLDFIEGKKMKIVPITGKYPDEAILQNIKKERRGLVATMDRELKRRIKKCGGSVISFSKDRIVLES